MKMILGVNLPENTRGHQADEYTAQQIYDYLIAPDQFTAFKLDQYIRTL